MKKIEKSTLKELLQIVPDQPMIRIAHFADGGMEMVDVLSGFCKEKAYEYQINATCRDFYTEVEAAYGKYAWVKCMNFSIERPRYMMQGKLYDVLFVTATIEEAMQEAFVMRCHPTIKNSGNIIIFLPKDTPAMKYEWLRLLEKYNYVASSTIEDMFEYYDILISKKMHGWGE